MTTRVSGSAIIRACGAIAALLGLALSSPSARAADTWRHGVIQAKSDAGFFFMAGNGFAEKQGLDLKFVQFKTDIIALQALIAGEIDSFDGGPGGSILADARGADVKVIGCHWHGLPYGIFVRDSIAKIEELKGKTFAISAPAANPAVVARGILAKYGVNPSDLNFANLGSDLDRFKAVVAGVAAGAIVSNEYEPVAKKQGVKMLVAAATAMPDYIRMCVMSSAKTLSTKHDAAVKFMAAEIEGFRYALAHRDEELKLTRSLTNIKPDDTRPEFIYDEAIRTHAIDPDLTIPMAKLSWMQEQLVKDGNLAQPYDVNKAVDPSIRAAALAKIGQK